MVWLRWIGVVGLVMVCGAHLCADPPAPLRGSLEQLPVVFIAKRTQASEPVRTTGQHRLAGQTGVNPSWTLERITPATGRRLSDSLAGCRHSDER